MDNAGRALDDKDAGMPAKARTPRNLDPREAGLGSPLQNRASQAHSLLKGFRLFGEFARVASEIPGHEPLKQINA